MIRALLLCLLSLSMLACAPGEPRPADPVWGKQPCAHCMMLVSETRPSAQLLIKGGERKFFDDIGCMIQWLGEGNAAPAGVWVRNARDDGWQAAASAHYTGGERTPMDYGFIPTAYGLTFTELTDHIRAKDRQRAARSP